MHPHQVRLRKGVMSSFLIDEKMGAGNVEFTAYSHATAAKKLLRSGSLVSRRTNGLPAEELEALSERGCRATAGSYRTDEKIVCELNSSTLLNSL